MKKYLPILLLFLLSCIEERDIPGSLLLSQIDSITISSEKSDYVLDGVDIIPGINLEYVAKDMESLNLERLIPQYYVNNSEVDQVLIPGDIAGNYEVFAMAGNKESNRITFSVIPLAEATESIELLGDKETFYKGDEVIDLTPLYDVLVTDIFDEEHTLEVTDHRISIYSDETLIDDPFNADIEPGTHFLTARIGNKVSNQIEIFVNDPFSIIQSIELSLDTLTNNVFALAGQSLLDFNVKFIDRDDNEITLNNYQLVAGDITYESTVDIPVEIGTNNFFIESYGVRSNAVIVDGREDLELPVREIPVVFHVYHNGEDTGSGNNIALSTMEDEIDRVNVALANQYRADLRKGQNAVNTYFKIAMATTDESGSTLAEAGVNRIEVSKEIFSYKSEETRQVMFDNMWDPYRYMNVHVLNLDDNFSFAYYPVMSEDLPGTSTDTSDDPSLNFPYGIALKNNHFGSFNQVLAHEIGHYLSLAHTFGVNDCSENDFVEDTQNYVNIESNLLQNQRISCDESVFLSTNFMDYNQGNYNTFTFDQRERMHFVYEYALFFPGVLGSPAPTGRVEITHWKGELDHSIEPVRCKLSVH